MTRKPQHQGFRVSFCFNLFFASMAVQTQRAVRDRQADQMIPSGIRIIRRAATSPQSIKRKFVRFFGSISGT